MKHYLIYFRRKNGVVDHQKFACELGFEGAANWASRFIYKDEEIIALLDLTYSGQNLDIKMP